MSAGMPARFPGSAARGLLMGFVSPRTMERVFDPIVADLHAEWSEAPSHGSAALAWVRAHAAIARAATALALLRTSRAVGESTIRFGAHVALAAALTFALFLVLAHLSSPDANTPQRPDPHSYDFVRDAQESTTRRVAP